MPDNSEKFREYQLKQSKQVIPVLNVLYKSVFHLIFYSIIITTLSIYTLKYILCSDLLQILNAFYEKSAEVRKNFRRIIVFI